MNIHNLKRMYNHILTVPEELLSMRHWRENKDWRSYECNTVGCVIGHCVQLDNIENIPVSRNGQIMFDKWSKNYTSIKLDSLEWYFLFSDIWAWSCFGLMTDTKEQILGRLKQFIFEQELKLEFSWNLEYDYLVTNPEYLDQTPFKL